MMRRTVLGAMAAAPFAASAARAGLTPSRPLIINALGELSDPNFWGEETGELASDRVIRDAIASGTSAINLTLGYVSGEEDPFEVSVRRSEEHTSELQSLMRISYAVFCLKQKNNKN